MKRKVEEPFVRANCWLGCSWLSTSWNTGTVSQRFCQEVACLCLAVDDLSSIRVQDLPRHVGSVIGRQEYIARGDLFRLSGALHWGFLPEVLYLIRRECGRNQ